MQHITALQCHEWMLRECSSLNQSRQQREDGLISSVTTISSAALLAIPGLFFTKNIAFPALNEGWLLYVGFAGFGLALILAMLEQDLSIRAYRRQIFITQNYYRLVSSDQDDKKSVAFVNYARVASISVFVFALAFSAIGLSRIGSNNYGRSNTASTASTASAASTAAASTAAASTATAASKSPVGLRERPEIRAGIRSAGATETVNQENDK